MSQKSNKKPVKATTTGQIGTKFESQRQSNILQLTNENLDVFNFRNNYPSSQGYNTPTSNSSVGNDSDDDAKTVNTNYSSNPYGLHTPPRLPNDENDEMDVDDYEPPATELLTREGKRMFYIINNKLEPVTNSNYIREMTIYDINRNIISRGEHFPEKIVYYNDIIKESTGGKKRRKPHRKTLRKTKRKNTRRHRRRHTRKYK
jgi:hypothetical protein